MLLKSKTGAFVMGCIYVLAAFISLTLLGLLSAPEEDLLDPIFKLDMSELPPGMRLLGWLSLAGSILLAGWILSWAIHGGSEIHFGRSGAARWAVGGFLYGMWANSVGLSSFAVYGGWNGSAGGRDADPGNTDVVRDSLSAAARRRAGSGLRGESRLTSACRFPLHTYGVSTKRNRKAGRKGVLS